jgi:hypothetical protein
MDTPKAILFYACMGPNIPSSQATAWFAFMSSLITCQAQNHTPKKDVDHPSGELPKPKLSGMARKSEQRDKWKLWVRRQT